jgi:D-alanyl-D-alanine carboxypeptidase
MSVGIASVRADPDADLAAQLDAAIEARIAAMGVPGAIVSLQIPGRISYDKAFGVGDTATGVPMLVDDHIRIGSVIRERSG